MRPCWQEAVSGHGYIRQDVNTGRPPVAVKAYRISNAYPEGQSGSLSARAQNFSNGPNRGVAHARFGRVSYLVHEGVLMNQLDVHVVLTCQAVASR